MRRLDELEAAAEHFTYAKDEKALEQSWDTWRHATQLRLAERALRDRVDLRIMANAIDTWRKHL